MYTCHSMNPVTNALPFQYC